LKSYSALNFVRFFSGPPCIYTHTHTHMYIELLRSLQSLLCNHDDIALAIFSCLCL